MSVAAIRCNNSRPSYEVFLFSATYNFASLFDKDAQIRPRATGAGHHTTLKSHTVN